MAMELGRKELPWFNADAVSELERYRWPGNIRELKNVVERAVYRAETSRIAHIEFDPFQSPYRTAPCEASPPQQPSPLSLAEKAADGDMDAQLKRPFKEAIAHLELHLLRNALEATRYNRSQAAQRLGLTYDQLRGLLRKHHRALGR
jgi:psp operon transcriptional activator